VATQGAQTLLSTRVVVDKWQKRPDVLWWQHITDDSQVWRTNGLIYSVARIDITISSVVRTVGL